MNTVHSLPSGSSQTGRRAIGDEKEMSDQADGATLTRPVMFELGPGGLTGKEVGGILAQGQP